ncbi:MAG TPA: hypothetical protein QGF58_12605 [Myxococcota bacterium]|nr:hypothetical protein [Myxococcota bacterium]
MLLMSTIAWAGEAQDLRYEVRIDEVVVGHRDLRISYVEAEDGERRLLESRTTCTIGGIEFDQHATGLGAAGVQGFSSSMKDQDGAWNIQAVRAPEGLVVHTVNAGGRSEKTLRHGEVDASTLGLMDPAIDLREGRLRVLSAETGDVIEGTLERADGGWAYVTESYTHHLVYGPDGHLLKWTTRWLGQDVELRLIGEPPKRDWGGVEPLGGDGVRVEEL